MNRLPLGKLPPRVMEKYIFGMSGAKSADVVVEPSLGLDFGVIQVGKRFVVVSSDPITGVQDRIGWYAVNVSANDVATSGNAPEFLQSVILLPEGADEAQVAAISKDMHETAKSLGIAIVGGHTEVTPGLSRPIVATTAFALASSYVTAAGARPGDSLMMTKTAGVEGTAILATHERFNKRLDEATIAEASGYFEELSVVREAVAAFSTGVVHAMHDCTEGGVLGALYEMAVAAKLGLEVDEAGIPVGKETAKICATLGVDALKLISSGTLLIAVERGKERLVKDAVSRAGSSATVIGRFGEGDVTLVRRGRKKKITGPPKDEIWRMHER